ncbi:Bestrophin homolog [Sergentomyia squamirostris]
MTVTYTAEVATCRMFGCFLKLLFRWRGSIYKLVWCDLVAFLVAHYMLTIIYRLVLNDNQKIVFEGMVEYCAEYTSLIPLSFVLGFYVTIVMSRWWHQYSSIPWPDAAAVAVSSNLQGQDERGRVMRRTVMRYVCLCLTMVLTMISPRVKKRFPTLEHLVDAGLLEENESKIMANFNSRFPRHSKHWMPIVWAASIVTRAHREGRIPNSFAVRVILDELNRFRGLCTVLLNYDNISVPLVYTQVVTLAVYTYFISSVFASQWYEDKKVVDYHHKIQIYFPLFTTLQFFFYMGWLKVAESLINPFGEDDDDFEVNWLIDRNLLVSYMIVDEMHHEHPELIRDQYWDEVFPTELPYTVGAEQFREKHPQSSTAKVEIAEAEAEVIHMIPSKVKVDKSVGGSCQKIDAATNSSMAASSNSSLSSRQKIVFPTRKVRITDQILQESDMVQTDSTALTGESKFSATSDDQTDNDDFERLRMARAKHRRERKLNSSSVRQNNVTMDAMDTLDFEETGNLEESDQQEIE